MQQQSCRSLILQELWHKFLHPRPRQHVREAVLGTLCQLDKCGNGLVETVWRCK